MQSIRTGQNIQGSGLFLLAVCNGGNFKRLLTKIVTSCIERVTGHFGARSALPKTSVLRVWVVILTDLFVPLILNLLTFPHYSGEGI